MGLLYLYLRKEHRLRGVENRQLRKTFGSKQHGGRDCIKKNFMICTPHQILFG